MMDKKIRRLIDDIFSDMKMTADNLALRDEMMANAQARYEDSVLSGQDGGGSLRRGCRFAGRPCRACSKR